MKAGPFGSSLRKEYYTPSGFKIYGQEQVIAGSASIGDYYIGEERYRSLESCRVEAGDILVSLVGTVGQALIVPEDAEPGIINPRLLRLSLDKDRADSQYVYYWLTSATTNALLNRYAQGGTMGVLNASILASVEILLPPLPEQSQIAEILSTWDEALALLDRRIELAQQRKRGLAQRLLTGRVRFPEFETEPWTRVRMQDVFTPVTRKTRPGTEAVLSISAGIGFEHQREKFGRVIAGKSLEKYTLLRRGEFAYNKGNSLTYPQGCVYRLEEYEEAAVPNVYFSFRAKSDDVYGPFYQHLFESGALNSELRRYINAGVRNDGLLNLDADDFYRAKIVHPCRAEQMRIAEVLDAATEEIALLRRKRELTAEQKKGLMQRLLTGRVRVKV